jgi:hypothetical protein
MPRLDRHLSTLLLKPRYKENGNGNGNGDFS